MKCSSGHLTLLSRYLAFHVFLANKASNVTFQSFFVVLMLLAFRKSNTISKWALKKSIWIIASNEKIVPDGMLNIMVGHKQQSL